MSNPYLLQSPNFKQMFLNSIQSKKWNFDALAFALPEISTYKLTTNLAFFLTLNIFKPYVVQNLNFKKMLLSSIETNTQILVALAVLVHEILTCEKKTPSQTFLVTQLNNSRTKHATALKFCLRFLWVFITFSWKFGVFPIVCSLFIKIGTPLKRVFFLM